MITIFIFLFLVFFIIIGLAYLLASLYNPDPNIKGGAILMLATFTFFLILFLVSVYIR
jgi:hypothetical protein